MKNRHSELCRGTSSTSNAHAKSSPGYCVLSTREAPFRANGLKSFLIELISKRKEARSDEEVHHLRAGVPGESPASEDMRPEVLEREPAATHRAGAQDRRRLIVQAHRQRRRISPEVQLLYRERAEDREARKLAREERRARLTKNDAIYCAACHTRVTVEYVDGVRIERRGFIPAGARAVKTVSHN